MAGDESTFDDRQLRDELARYGLSETEAATYLAVVRRGSARASDVADAADVSPSYVYSVCQDLEEAGFVLVDDHRTPTRIRARPPEEAFGDLHDDLSAIESSVEERYQGGPERRGSFELVKSRSTVVKRIEAIVDASQHEVLFQLPVEALSDVRDALERAVARGVLVLLVLGGDDDRIAAADLDGVANVVRAGISGTPTILAADQRVGLVAPSRALDWEHDEGRGTVFDQDEITTVLVASILGNYWPMASEVAVSRPRRTPESYEMFRPLVFDATLRRRAGEAVRVRTDARPTGSDAEYETMTGEVVGVTQNLVEPLDSDFGLENALAVDVGDSVVGIGGTGAFLEEYEAESVTLLADD